MPRCRRQPTPTAIRLHYRLLGPLLTTALLLITGTTAQLPSNYTTLAISVAGAEGTCKNGKPPINLVETNISSVQQAFLAQKLSCSDLVRAYIQRIGQYDKLLGLNSVRELNPAIQSITYSLDAQLSQVLAGNGTLPPLFCVPLLVKDNFETQGMAACNGAVSLLDNIAPQDAHVVQLLRKAGAVVLAKTNMAEWAFSPDRSVGSAFGVVRNPYQLDYLTAGSSGGTAAGLAANLGLAGLGTDTGNSVRGPSGHCAMVGIRPSLGLTSRTGIIPLDVTSDTSGPIARTVTDAARLLTVMVGQDSADNLTSLLQANGPPSNYTQFLQKGLSGFRVGVMRQVIDTSTADSEFTALFNDALSDLASAGATIVDNFTIGGNSLGALSWDGRLGEWYTGYGLQGHWEDIQCDRFRNDIDVYLANASSHYKGIESIIADGGYHPYINETIIERVNVPYSPGKYPPAYLQAQGYRCTCGQFYDNVCRATFRQALVNSMDSAGIDVMVYPTWSNPALLVGDYSSPDGNNSPQIAPPTGAPAIAVPMGYNDAGLPASLQILARPFAEGTAIRVAYAYEQATGHRSAPALFPECGGGALPPWGSLAPSPAANLFTSSSVSSGR